MYECDECGRFYKKHGVPATRRIDIPNPVNGDGVGCPVQVRHVCPECAESLRSRYGSQITYDVPLKPV